MRVVSAIPHPFAYTTLTMIHTYDGLTSRRSVGTSSRDPTSHDTRPYAHVTGYLLAFLHACIPSPQFIHLTGTEG